MKRYKFHNITIHLVNNLEAFSGGLHGLSSVSGVSTGRQTYEYWLPLTAVESTLRGDFLQTKI